MNNAFNLAWRLFKHEAKRGELTIILFAIILSVASVLSLSLFSERLQSALTARTAELIAADRLLDSEKPIDVAWIEKAQEMGLEATKQVYARSMVFGNEQMTLTSLRAADQGYPLKGQVKTSLDPYGLGKPTDELPAPGEAWAESRYCKP